MKGSSSVLEVYLVHWVYFLFDTEVHHIFFQNEHKDKKPFFQILLCMLCSFEDTCLFLKATNLSKLLQASAQHIETESLVQLCIEELERATYKQGQSHLTSTMLYNASMRLSQRESIP